jgi:hypothetical protein
MNTDNNLPASALPITKYDIYFIHDNGGVPFRVAIDELGMRAIVYVCQYDFDQSYESDNSYATEPIILNTTFEKIFLGGPLSDELIANSSNFELGNSILLHITGNRYIFIGMYIYAFESPEPILEYSSPIGNNDVPYPFAKSASETFLMIEDAVLDNKILDEEAYKYPNQAYNPYNLYYRYGAQMFFFGNKYLEKKRKIGKQIIKKRL